MSKEVFEKIYKIEKTIYKSKNSRVSVAECIETSEKVIVKKIEKKNDKSKKRILNEYHIPKLIDCNGIIKTNKYIEDKYNCYLIYPYNPISISLYEMDYNNKDYEFFFQIICQLCDTIKKIHDMDFIHRDIKPHNIIVQDTQAYLIDFDLACSLSDPKFPIQPKLTGTPNYIAPEIWMYEKNIDYKLTDIYSFGITIYYIFNKKKCPYKCKSISDMEYAIRNIKPNKCNSGYDYIDDFVMKIIDKNPKNRPDLDTIKNFFSKLL
ncbi:putative serine/threonine protein kinase [Powai lake megavirus]|uniref:Putative serine/threonine protein kinase n=1 Tax=Powai lake megavirus TaxID=1842663 RepID=A0A167RDR9_9VIRU|nr:putative serine/threonine protein kinase [Powai lake megavirus]ANB50568.1 putative serine/threonine protein kinase [Powai lake megavirus]